MTIVDKRNPLPCYYQVYQYLRHSIENDVYKAGEQLPSERELAEKFKVNRFTIRKAEEKLILDGLVYPIRRKGYFVKFSPVAIDIDKNTSYSRYVDANNIPHRVKIQEVRPEYPSEEISQLFQLEKGELVWSVYILRYFQNIPSTLTRSYIPFRRMPDLNKHLGKSLSLYKTFKEVYGIVPQRISSVCQVSFADQKEFRLLAVYNNFPLLQVTSTVVDRDGLPVEYCISKFRSDIVKLNVKIFD